MFLDDELYKIGSVTTDPTTEELVGIISKMLNACLHYLRDKANTKPDSEFEVSQNIISMKRVDHHWRNAATKLKKNGFPAIEDGWETFMKEGQEPYPTYAKLIYT